MKSYMLLAFISMSCVCAPLRMAQADEQLAVSTEAEEEALRPPVDMEHLIIADATPLSAIEMETLRGGFVDPTGMIYSFGVNVQTALDGAEVFTRSILVTPTGPNGALQATSNATVVPKNIPNAVNVTMVDNGNGVVVTTPTSPNSTTALNQTAAGAPASIILNTESNRTIAQSVDVTLTLHNLSAVMTNLRSASQSAAMAQHTALKGMGF